MPGGGILVAGLENRVREVSPDGIINTVAGTGIPCPVPNDPCGDGGKASAARFNDAHGVAALPDGGFLVADRKDNRIRKVATSGVIETVVGTGAACAATSSSCGSGGQARAAQLNSPIGMTLTSGGGYLVLDGGSNLVRYVSDAGTISTVAGIGASCEPSGRVPRTQEKAGANAPVKASGSCGDGGPAREAALSSPHSASFVPAGVIIDDRDDDRVRLLTGTGLHAP
jgi:serine/threonine-protein kinase